MLDRVLAALVSRDTTRLAGARYTENGQELAIGDGLWATCDATGPYRHDFTDNATGSAATFTTVTEGTARALAAIRVAAANGAITEIEAIVVRPGLLGSVSAYPDGPDRLDAAGAAEPRWFAQVPPAERLPRAVLVRVANAYFSAIERNDGKGYYPFSDDCVRFEHGYQTSGEPRAADTPYAPDFKALGVKQQFETGFFRFVTEIRDRRFVAIDEELGVVCAMAFFDHAGTVRDYELADGTPVSAGLTRPFTWQIAEAFKIENGLITRIEAILQPCPYGMKPGWP